MHSVLNTSICPTREVKVGTLVVCSSPNALAAGLFEVSSLLTRLMVHHSQVSFANAICTTKGGTHVNYITDQVTKCVPAQRGYPLVFAFWDSLQCLHMSFKRLSAAACDSWQSWHN